MPPAPSRDSMQKSPPKIVPAERSPDAMPRPSLPVNEHATSLGAEAEMRAQNRRLRKLAQHVVHFPRVEEDLARKIAIGRRRRRTDRRVPALAHPERARGFGNVSVDVPGL